MSRQTPRPVCKYCGEPAKRVVPESTPYWYCETHGRLQDPEVLDKHEWEQTDAGELRCECGTVNQVRVPDPAEGETESRSFECDGCGRELELVVTTTYKKDPEP